MGGREEGGRVGGRRKVGREGSLCSGTHRSTLTLLSTG